MCGLCGFIGESLDPEVSYELITKLLEKSEIRGTDAAGFWGSQAQDGKTLYHKEPGYPTNFVKREVWRDIKELNPNILLVHAREASSGVGSPSFNKNNHPFVNSDLSIGLIHNGRVPDNVYKALTKKYEVFSACDSEIFLRVFENGSADAEIEKQFGDVEMTDRIAGVKDIWSLVTRAHMAVAIGERMTNGNRRLWLFRNEHRTLWLVDLREQLGQIFFCSTEEIWRSAKDECSRLRPLLQKKAAKLIQLPPNEIWAMEISNDSPVVTNDTLFRVGVHPAGQLQPWQYDGPPIKLERPKNLSTAHTLLGPDDEIEKKNTPIVQNWYEDLVFTKDLGTFEKTVSDIKNALTDLEVFVTNNLDCITATDLESLVENLLQTKIDLINNLTILDVR